MPGWIANMQNMNIPTNRCQHRAGNSQRLDVLRAWKKETPDRAEGKPWQIVGAHFGRIEAAANVPGFRLRRVAARTRIQRLLYRMRAATRLLNDANASGTSNAGGRSHLW